MVLIQTHNGKIHADETIAVALLSTYYSKLGVDVSILRSRDPRDFPRSNILVDVGHQYDPNKNFFDHHQEGFGERWSSESPTPLSAAGLIWRHFGEEIVKMYLSSNWEEFDFSENHTEETIRELVDIIYQKILLEVDADDNGIIINRDDREGINIPNVISSLNHTDTGDDQKQNENFNKAIDLVNTILDIEFKSIIKKYFDFNEDIEKVSKYNLSHDYLIVQEKIPTIFKCLEVLDPGYNIKFLIFNNGEKWTVKTRNLSKFDPIVPLPNSEQALKLPHSDDIMFLHKSGFLAKTKTLDSALELIHEALNPKIADIPVNIPKYDKKMKIATYIVGGSLVLAFTAWWWRE